MTDETVGGTENGGTASGEKKPAIKENIKLQSTWMRGLYLLLFLIIWGIAKTLVIAVMVFQFLSLLFVRKINGNLVPFSHSLSRFVYEITLYLTFASDERPFPFNRWPSENSDESEPEK